MAWLTDALALGPGVRVADLAAGTGKFTRLLVPTGAETVAIEPVAGMWQQLRATSPAVPIVAGAAERLPLADASLDATTVAQAFHWFDARAAFAELARVLRSGGRVGILWNARDRSVAWVDEVWGIMDRLEKEAPWRDHDAWRDSALGERPGFGPLHRETFHHEQLLPPRLVVERFRGVSHVAALPDEEKARVLDEVREVLASHPDTVGQAELTIPYRVDAMWCERL
ncbi:MAG: class I SAM-dependent methyltransferase [Acidimicrobiia bacterium]